MVIPCRAGSRRTRTCFPLMTTSLLRHSNVDDKLLTFFNSCDLKSWDSKLRDSSSFLRQTVSCDSRRRNSAWQRSAKRKRPTSSQRFFSSLVSAMRARKSERWPSSSFSRSSVQRCSRSSRASSSSSRRTPSSIWTRSRSSDASVLVMTLSACWQRDSSSSASLDEIETGVRPASSNLRLKWNLALGSLARGYSMCPGRGGRGGGAVVVVVVGLVVVGVSSGGGAVVSASSGGTSVSGSRGGVSGSRRQDVSASMSSTTWSAVLIGRFSQRRVGRVDVTPSTLADTSMTTLPCFPTVWQQRLEVSTKHASSRATTRMAATTTGMETGNPIIKTCITSRQPDTHLRAIIFRSCRVWCNPTRGQPRGASNEKQNSRLATSYWRSSTAYILISSYTFSAIQWPTLNTIQFPHWAKRGVATFIIHRLTNCTWKETAIDYGFDEDYMVCIITNVEHSINGWFLKT